MTNNDELEKRIKEMQELLDKKPNIVDESANEDPVKKEQANLKKIISVYESFLSEEEIEYDDSYKVGNNLVTSRKTLYKFISSLKKYKDKNNFITITGEFLSGLINNIKGNKELTLSLDDLAKTINHSRSAC